MTDETITLRCPICGREEREREAMFIDLPGTAVVVCGCPTCFPDGPDENYTVTFLDADGKALYGGP